MKETQLEAADNTNALTVLVVDDFAAGRDLLASTVEAAGFASAQADGCEACRKKAREEADLILLDAILPGCDVFELLDELRSDRHTRSIPIVLYSPVVPSELPRRATSAGVDTILRKPFHKGELQRAIVRSLDAARKLPPGTPHRDQDYYEALKAQLRDRLKAGHEVTLVPFHDPEATIGYTYPDIAGQPGMEKDTCLNLIDELAAEGLLDRKLHNRVRLCPRCASHRLNFREACPSCGSIDFQTVEPDTDSTGGAVACESCSHTFDESHMEMQCFQCAYVAPATAAVVREVYEYCPTDRTAQAADPASAQSIDMAPLLSDPQLSLLRREDVEAELDKEFQRARRYGEPLSLVLFALSGLEGIQDADGLDTCYERLRELLRRFDDMLRPSDTLGLVRANEFSLLLPNTPVHGAEVVSKKLFGVLDRSDQGPIRMTLAVASLLDEHESSDDLLNAARDLLQQARERGDGTMLVA